MDADGVEVAKQPLSVFIQFNTPKAMDIEAGDVQMAIEGAFSLLFTTVTSDDPDVAVISKLLRGIVQVL